MHTQQEMCKLLKEQTVYCTQFDAATHFRSDVLAQIRIIIHYTVYSGHYLSVIKTLNQQQTTLKKILHSIDYNSWNKDVTDTKISVGKKINKNIDEYFAFRLRPLV